MTLTTQFTRYHGLYLSLILSSLGQWAHQ